MLLSTAVSRMAGKHQHVHPAPQIILQKSRPACALSAFLSVVASVLAADDREVTSLSPPKTRSPNDQKRLNGHIRPSPLFPVGVGPHGPVRAHGRPTRATGRPPMSPVATGHLPLCGGACWGAVEARDGRWRSNLPSGRALGLTCRSQLPELTGETH